MKNELKSNLTYNKTMLVLSALCIISGFASLFLGEFIIPIASASLAAIICFEDKSKRLYSCVSALSLLLINVIAIFLKFQLISFWSLIAIIIAVVISHAYLNSSNKAQSAFLLTAISAALLVVPLILSAMTASGEFTFESAISFYEDIFSQMRKEFILYVNQLGDEIELSAGADTFDTQYFIDIYDYQVSMIISYVVIAAFVLVGLTFKCFDIIIKRCVNDDSHILSWRFTTDNIFAYFYLILAVVSLFMPTPDSILAVTVVNLYNIFMFIYFYVGYMLARDFFSRGRQPLFSRILFVLVVITFLTYAIEILALIGAFATIKTNNDKILPED